MTNGQTQGSRSTILASLAAIGGVLAASSCCLPILPFVLAAGFAGSSAVLTSLRPYLLGASILLVGFGFYRAWRARQCRSRQSVLSSVLLWTSGALVLVSTLFPQMLANAAADLFAK